MTEEEIKACVIKAVDASLIKFLDLRDKEMEVMHKCLTRMMQELKTLRADFDRLTNGFE